MQQNKLEMKARIFRKLRRKLRIQTYRIQETAGLFGDFDGINRMSLKMPGTFVVATSPIRAITIYMRNYRRNNNRINEYESDNYRETAEKWAYLMVTDEKGHSTFYE